MTEEQYLHGRLRELHEAYQREAEPILRRLADLAARRPMPPVLVRIEDLPPELLAKLKWTPA